MSRGYTLQQVCRDVGKNHVYLGQIQASLDLHKPEPPRKYNRGYINFLTKCTALRTFGVQLGDVQDLFRKEVKVLKLLNLHTYSDSPTWYLDGCTLDEKSTNRLLLTGFDIGFDILQGPVQSGLDFGSPERELFASHQMGESLDHVIQLYRKQLMKVRRRVEEERPIIRKAIAWSSRAFNF